jgi:hypothetical protein
MPIGGNDTVVYESFVFFYNNQTRKYIFLWSATSSGRLSWVASGPC